jgi:hypothetical protein
MADQEDPRLGLAKEAAETTARYRAASEKIRARADNWGKSLMTLGTAVVGYLGATKATDVFPIPPGWWFLPVLTFVLLALMAAAAVAVGWRLSRVGRPIVMKVDPDEITDLTKQERTSVAQLYLAQAQLNGAASLNAYDECAQQIFLAWEHHKPNDPEPDQPYSRGAQIRAEVQSAMQRGATLVVQRRYTAATTGKVTMTCVVVFLAAAIGVGLATNKLDAVRASDSVRITERLVTIKECAEAQAGKLKNPSITLPLPPECFS